MENEVILFQVRGKFDASICEVARKKGIVLPALECWTHPRCLGYFTFVKSNKRDRSLL